MNNSAHEEFNFNSNKFDELGYLVSNKKNWKHLYKEFEVSILYIPNFSEFQVIEDLLPDNSVYMNILEIESNNRQYSENQEITKYFEYNIKFNFDQEETSPTDSQIAFIPDHMFIQSNDLFETDIIQIKLFSKNGIDITKLIRDRECIDLSIDYKNKQFIIVNTFDYQLPLELELLFSGIHGDLNEILFLKSAGATTIYGDFIYDFKYIFDLSSGMYVNINPLDIYVSPLPFINPITDNEHDPISYDMRNLNFTWTVDEDPSLTFTQLITPTGIELTDDEFETGVNWLFEFPILFSINTYILVELSDTVSGQILGKYAIEYNGGNTTQSFYVVFDTVPPVDDILAGEELIEVEFVDLLDIMNKQEFNVRFLEQNFLFLNDYSFKRKSIQNNMSINFHLYAFQLDSEKQTESKKVNAHNELEEHMNILDIGDSRHLNSMRIKQYNS